MKATHEADSILFNSTEEEIKFYRKIIDKAPAFIGIQQMDDLTDPMTNHNIWANEQALEFLGYARSEIKSLGAEFFMRTMHPMDMAIIGNALKKFESDHANWYAGVYRLKPKGQDYKWVVGAIRVMDLKNGKPWRFLNITLEIDDLKDTQEQIIALTKENLQLKNKLMTNTLTKREKEIIRLIAGGKTDKEIGKVLFISPATAKTHRNNILRKLNLKNSASVVRFAAENGLD